MTTDGVTVPAARALHAAARALLPGGEEAAAVAARALVEAELSGHRTFGLTLLDALLPEAEPRAAVRAAAVTGAGARAELDGHGAFGPLVVAQAAVAAGELVGRHGLAAVAIRGLGRLGRLAPYVRHLAADGHVALLVANAPPAVAPAGGRGPVIGTNPVAVALPVEGGDPLVVDTATSTVTQAALRAAAGTGRPLPPGTAIDAGGRPTTDAAAAWALLPRGGVFGSAIGLVVEAIAAGLTGVASFSPAPRSAVLVAFAADPAAAATGAELVERWAAAGGHVPGGGSRADAAGDAPVALGPATVRTLDLLAPGW